MINIKKTKDILYGTYKLIILVFGLCFLVQVFSIVNLFIIMILKLSLAPLQYLFNTLYALAFVLLVMDFIPEDFFIRKKKKEVKDGNTRRLKRN